MGKCVHLNLSVSCDISAVLLLSDQSARIGGSNNFNSLIALPSCRWIKFEEKVEQGGERWSKPHVATLSLHSLFELRTCIEKGSIMLDMEASSLPQVVGK